MHIMVRDVSFLRSLSFREVKIALISLNAVDLVNVQSTVFVKNDKNVLKQRHVLGFLSFRNNTNIAAYPKSVITRYTCS